jgi:hypothetical protein
VTQLASIALILVQIAALAALWGSARTRSSSVFHTYFNPLCFFILFYVLFFGVEQVTYQLNGFAILGADFYATGQGLPAYAHTQVALCGMLSALLLGNWITVPLLGRANVDHSRPLFGRSENASEKLLLWLFFTVGILAAAYLGRQFAALGGFRSELVKSPGGAFATALSFWANFAYAWLLFIALRDRRYVVAAVITLIFGLAIVYTGSRGRFLWPAVIGVAMFLSYRNIFPKNRIVLVAIAVLAVLSVMDPIRKLLIDPGDNSLPSLTGSFSSLVLTRNFDGFANFDLIYTTRLIAPSAHFLFTGVRDVFMNTFFPLVYQSGVGFGSTIPGYFYLSGGTAGLLYLGFGFGILLGLLNALLRFTTNRWLLSGYFFGVVWLTAVGGDLVESLDKMVAAMLPGLLMFVLQRSLRISRRPMLPQREQAQRLRIVG